MDTPRNQKNTRGSNLPLTLKFHPWDIGGGTPSLKFHPWDVGGGTPSLKFRPWDIGGGTPSVIIIQ